MASEHPNFEKPKSVDAKIWRYMSFSKFVSLLETKSLFFARPDTFNDALEGSYSLAPIMVTQSALDSNNASDPLTYLKELKENRKMVRDTMLKMHYINCWHLNEMENDGMWRLYGDISQTICVQSTFKRFWDATEKDVNIGLVKYVDYNEYNISLDNCFNLFLHKRKCFEHEQEMRAIIFRSLPGAIRGIYSPVDLKLLIESISLPPGCTDWFQELMVSIITRYQLDVPVKRSDLEMQPIDTPNYILDPALEGRIDATVTSGSKLD